MRHRCVPKWRMRPSDWTKIVEIQRAALLLAVSGLLVSSGCTESAAPEPAKLPAQPSQVSAVPPRPPSAAVAEPPAATAPVTPVAPIEAAAAAANPEPERSGSIVKRTTQDIRDAPAEQAKGAQAVQPRVTGKDPITLSGSAYVHMIGRTSQLKIEAAVKLFHGEHGRYPKDLDEFMREIIKANNIRLPELPPYQKYGYNAERHSLVILEYPH